MIHDVVDECYALFVGEGCQCKSDAPSPKPAKLEHVVETIQVGCSNSLRALILDCADAFSGSVTTQLPRLHILR